jgi:hypothetical protein
LSLPALAGAALTTERRATIPASVQRREVIGLDGTSRVRLAQERSALDR